MRDDRRGEIEILLVEDNPGDVRLVMEALKDSGIQARFHVAGDGVEAERFLRREGKHGGAPRPDLILLDLNLPRRDGRELLAIIKQDADLKRIPVVVVSSSQSDQDILAAYNLHANCYVAKSVDLQQSLAAMRSIQQFWLTTVSLPPG